MHFSSWLSVNSRQKRDEADKGEGLDFTTGVFLGSQRSHDWLSARPRGREEDIRFKIAEHCSSYNMIKHNTIISNNITFEKKVKLASTLMLIVLIN